MVTSILEELHAFIFKVEADVEAACTSETLVAIYQMAVVSMTEKHRSHLGPFCILQFSFFPAFALLYV
jgi:hypothetical protein